MEIYTNNTNKMTAGELIELAWNKLLKRLNEERFVEFVSMVKEIADELNGAIEFVDKKSLSEFEDFFDNFDGDPRATVEFIRMCVPSRIDGKRVRFMTAAPEDNRMMVVSMIESDGEITIACSDARYIDSLLMRSEPIRDKDVADESPFVQLYDAILKTRYGICEDVTLIQRARRENLKFYDDFKIENKTDKGTTKAMIVAYAPIKKITVYPYIEEIAEHNEPVSKWYNPLHRE